MYFITLKKKFALMPKNKIFLQQQLHLHTKLENNSAEKQICRTVPYRFFFFELEDNRNGKRKKAIKILKFCAGNPNVLYYARNPDISVALTETMEKRTMKIKGTITKRITQKATVFEGFFF